MKLLSLGPVESGLAGFEAALADALVRFELRPKLAILYLPIAADHVRYLARAKARLGDVPLIGMTTGGAAFTERGTSESGAVMALIGGDVEAEIAVARDLGRDDGRSMSEVLGRLSYRGATNVVLLTMMDAFAMDGERLVSMIRKHTPLHCRAFGGTAGDDWKFTGTRVFWQNEVLSGAAVFAVLRLRRPVSVSVGHGWCAVPNARDLVITEIEANCVKKLNDRTAAEVYREELTRLGLLEPGEELVQAFARYELGARTPFGEQLKIRAPLALGDDGSITLASSLAKSDIVRVVAATSAELVAAARRTADEAYAKARMTGALQGALVFDCAARRQLLGAEYPQQASAFCGDGKHPVVGVACYGEIARVGGIAEGFHNTTAVVAAW